MTTGSRSLLLRAKHDTEMVDARITLQALNPEEAPPLIIDGNENKPL